MSLAIDSVMRNTVKLELVLWLGLELAYFRELCYDIWTPKQKL